MVDLLIIGAGPAGVSAAIYAKRLGISVKILYSGESNLEKASQIDNYYGFENGISGKELYDKGVIQAKNLGIDVDNEEVFNIGKENDLFFAETEKERYISKAVIIATGNKKIRPDIEGLVDYEGKGISYCAICDGFFYKNKNVVVIGDGKYAINEANNLKNVAESVTILTNDENTIENSEFEVVAKKINKIFGENKVQGIEFQDGEKMYVDGVFIAVGEAGGTDFARNLGIALEKDSIVVNEDMQTNIEGLFACGNAVGGLLQVCKSTYEGAKAGLSAANYVMNK
ncbi:MAG: NAD(P)/FAD-dependent oxidoreductase [Clostridia bacterium]|nr:NAD(P)/FAD-dependent oxidoreductase [Clostridia bacterium]